MEENGRSGVTPPEVDVRPLGLLAVGASALALPLALTGFFSPYAVLLAALALVLGLAARTEPRTRSMGTAAVVLAVAAVAIAVATFCLLLSA